MSRKGCFTDPPVAFQPSKNGLVAWYDTNSAVFSGGSLTSWRDRNEYENNLIPGGEFPISPNFNFRSNILYKSNIEFQLQNTGASIFIVCSFCNNTFGTPPSANNMVTIFSSNYRAAQPAGKAFSVSMFNYSGTETDFIINTYDLLNSYATFSNELDVGSYTGKQIVNAICFNSNFNGSYSRAYINGSNVSCNSSLINISSDINTYNLWLGDWPTGTGSPGPDGVNHVSSGSYSMFEVLVYNRVLSESETSSVNRYLAAKNSTTALANSGNFQY
jgi:hypothetical protein